MAADHLFVNATDAIVADITAATGTTAAVAARATSAASSTSADLASFLHTAGAYAILPTGATAAHKRAVAITLLRDSGLFVSSDIATALLLSDPEKRNKFKLKASVQDAQDFFNAVAV